jgi:lipoate-protein ligase A
MLIIAVAAHVTDIFGSKRFFRLIQTPIQEALGHVGIEGVRQRGISDLAYGERKILGSSMRRKGTILLYQAVLLVDVQREIFGELLQHPPKEPDYRQGRDHDSFTVTLRELGFSGSISSVQDAILHQFDTRLHTLLAEELV